MKNALLWLAKALLLLVMLIAAALAFLGWMGEATPLLIGGIGGFLVAGFLYLRVRSHQEPRVSSRASKRSMTVPPAPQKGRSEQVTHTAQMYQQGLRDKIFKGE